jgi:hypothetical protein
VYFRKTLRDVLTIKLMGESCEIRNEATVDPPNREYRGLKGQVLYQSNCIVEAITFLNQTAKS